jgi:hypothetical protein
MLSRSMNPLYAASIGDYDPEYIANGFCNGCIFRLYDGVCDLYSVGSERPLCDGSCREDVRICANTRQSNFTNRNSV